MVPLLEELRGVQGDSRVLNDKMVTMDGFNNCILGICMRFGQEDIVAYDYVKVIETLMENDGMSYEEAMEFFDFNQLGAWVGDHTPCFILLDIDKRR